MISDRPLQCFASFFHRLLLADKPRLDPTIRSTLELPLSRPSYMCLSPAPYLYFTTGFRRSPRFLSVASMILPLYSSWRTWIRLGSRVLYDFRDAHDKLHDTGSRRIHNGQNASLHVPSLERPLNLFLPRCPPRGSQVIYHGTWPRSFLRGSWVRCMGSTFACTYCALTYCT
ncbi:hypothetical protein EDB84DRAFT_715651 [Lactarius hengduanensis]|nr:hypothetical protein EDB84DRAFT_715651 [Lactarius hengduanensis]